VWNHRRMNTFPKSLKKQHVNSAQPQHAISAAHHLGPTPRWAIARMASAYAPDSEWSSFQGMEKDTPQADTNAAELGVSNSGEGILAGLYLRAALAIQTAD
jgi:hypothetical protein